MFYEEYQSYVCTMFSGEYHSYACTMFSEEYHSYGLYNVLCGISQSLVYTMFSRENQSLYDVFREYHQ